MSGAAANRRRVLAACAGFVLLTLAGPAGRAQVLAPSPSSDEPFIESLTHGAPDAPVDRRQLALLFVEVAEGLEAGKAALATVLTEVEAQPVAPGADPGLARARFAAYERNLTSFAKHVRELNDEPNSRLVFYQVFTSGQRTCWTLDLFGRLAEMRAASPQRLTVQLPSREACARFRTAVFHTRVEAILEDALVEQVYQRHELGELRQEVRELEQLVEELIRKDSE